MVLGISAALLGVLPVLAGAQATGRVSATPQLQGRVIEQVRILGNAQVPTSIIRNVIRSASGDKYDPATVEDDYRRVYELKKFSNVEAQVEPTTTGGVNVVFVVTEQKLIRKITYRGNVQVDTPTLESVSDLKVGQAIDSFRISLAQQAIVNTYRDKNFPEAHVDVPTDPLTQRGELIFSIVEGPQVRIRKINFIGAHYFSANQLQDKIRTNTWLPIFRPGKYDPEIVEEDMGAIRRQYSDHGFFDVRVGRKLIYSPDNTELQIDFLIDEGPRYVVEQVAFEDNQALSDARLRADLKLREGMYYDFDTVQRDVKQIVKGYSKFGFIYFAPGQGGANDPDYFRVEPQEVFLAAPGRIKLLYRIHEGKPFRLNRILIKGNEKSQDKLVLREFRDLVPGSVYNSGAVEDAQDRLRGLPFFSQVTATPIGDDPEFRDLLIEVVEGKTANFKVGAGISSAGGIGGQIAFEQKNFDIANVPNDWRDIISEHAFTGAGQGFSASFEPGTIFTSADLGFTEPWLFDQPYLFSDDIYLRDALREHYIERHIGDNVTFGKRFDYINSASISLRGERVDIGRIDDPRYRPFEILDQRGSHLVTSVGLEYQRNTVNPGVLPYEGTITSTGVELFGALGGDYSFQKYNISWSGYQTLSQDLLDRRTVLNVHLKTEFITGRSVFFERFYGGGYGNLRGFEFRGVGPRGGRGRDPVGGDFSATGSVEINFPIYENILRGVIFADFGEVENDVKIGVIRTSVGPGIRFTLPFFGQVPFAIDFGIPITRARHDQTQFISFSLGVTQF